MNLILKNLEETHETSGQKLELIRDEDIEAIEIENSKVKTYLILPENDINHENNAKKIFVGALESLHSHNLASSIL